MHQRATLPMITLEDVPVSRRGPSFAWNVKLSDPLAFAFGV
jgi:hypothetical protein